MSRSPAPARQRRQKLTALLSARRNVSTAQIARRFKVNPMTIRRDLKALETSGVALRCYGGAIAAERITFEFVFDERRRRNLAQKQRIGAAAAAGVRPGQTVFLDTGTTTLEIARSLAAMDTACTVVTNSLVVASELWGRGRAELVLLGGRARKGSPDLVGAAAEVMLEGLTADVAFVGSDGLESSRGSFASDMEAARIAQRMAGSARKVVVVADGSKLGAAGAARCLMIQDIDEVISDRAAPEKVVADLRRQGVKVTLV